MIKITKILMVILFAVFVLIGCGRAEKKLESSEQAIDFTKSMENVKEKTDYLMKQANLFYESDDFKEAMDITKYILDNLDKDFKPAKDLLEDAKENLKAVVEKQLQNKLNNR